MTTDLLQEESSKFNAKVQKSVDNDVKVNPILGMFDDSNESFEIPETQADPINPPRDHIDDELSSEGFVAIPDEEIQTQANDFSQSQDLLCGVSLHTQLNVTRSDCMDEGRMPNDHGIKEIKNEVEAKPRFDHQDEDTTDLEMSRLEWDDSAKDVDQVKSASVTPDLDFDMLSSTKAVVDGVDKSASVTPDLDFDEFTSSKADAIRSASVTPDLDFDLSANSAVKNFMFTSPAAFSSDLKEVRSLSFRRFYLLFVLEIETNSIVAFVVCLICNNIYCTILFIEKNSCTTAAF